MDLCTLWMYVIMFSMESTYRAVVFKLNCTNDPLLNQKNLATQQSYIFSRHFRNFVNFTIYYSHRRKKLFNLYFFITSRPTWNHFAAHQWVATQNLKTTAIRHSHFRFVYIFSYLAGNHFITKTNPESHFQE